MTLLLNPQPGCMSVARVAPLVPGQKNFSWQHTTHVLVHAPQKRSIVILLFQKGLAARGAQRTSKLEFIGLSEISFRAPLIKAAA